MLKEKIHNGSCFEPRRMSQSQTLTLKDFLCDLFLLLCHHFLQL
jgi:hypothetical protein